MLTSIVVTMSDLDRGDDVFDARGFDHRPAAVAGADAYALLLLAQADQAEDEPGAWLSKQAGSDSEAHESDQPAAAPK